MDEKKIGQQEEWDESHRQNDLPTGNDEFVSFPVNLTREEYIRFNLAISGATGMLRFRRGQLALFFVMTAISLFMVAVDAVQSQVVDPVMVLLILFLLASGFTSFFGLPAHIRKAAIRTFDQTSEVSQSYYGQVVVFSDRVEKRSSRGNVSVRFQQNAVYIETQDMMILAAPNVPAIVLPARCLTAADADQVRRAVLPGIPAERQRLNARMIPTATAHILPPSVNEEDEEDEEHLQLDVLYTREEFVKIITDTAGRAFMKMLPFYSALSVVTGLTFGLLYGFKYGILAFLLTIGILFFLNVLKIRLKAGRSYANMPANGARIRVRFTDKGITVRSGSTGDAMRLVWKTITRAVERSDCVEFYTATTLLRIPKRCIADMGELKELVDSHIHPKAAAR